MLLGLPLLWLLDGWLLLIDSWAGTLVGTGVLLAITAGYVWLIQPRD